MEIDVPTAIQEFEDKVLDLLSALDNENIVGDDALELAARALINGTDYSANLVGFTPSEGDLPSRVSRIDAMRITTLAWARVMRGRAGLKYGERWTAADEHYAERRLARQATPPVTATRAARTWRSGRRTCSTRILNPSSTKTHRHPCHATVRLAGGFFMSSAW